MVEIIVRDPIPPWTGTAVEKFNAERTARRNLPNVEWLLAEASLCQANTETEAAIIAANMNALRNVKLKFKTGRVNFERFADLLLLELLIEYIS